MQCDVFDSKGKIMVSTGRNAIIKIWNFDNGMIKQTHSLLGHQVICLVHSQINNYFVSGSSDGSIIMWKYYDNNEWKSSKLQNKHKKYIYCIILTENENQLISCSDDSSIKVWTVNFNNHESNFLYSLDKHAGSVYSLSLNQSEKVLVSCGSDQIIIWKKEINTQWKFQYVVNQSIQEYGFHVKFLKEDQFIWAPYKSNNLCVFECKDDGLYQENIEKRVQFKKDNKGLVGLSGFPIIYNKLKNMICLRHVCHICLLKFENDGQLSIVEELDCLNWEIYGTVTNNGQYLVFWGKKKDTYQAYEILYK
ncbi:unnamed protein product [Paramecium sonneborni]|uniref:Uncharacterized protein n=1 Tax=Paramecium sonneborni TaxID=65129 RepID=A0A8S1MGQ3_9CILI|nr:unnamed protein product [Paramecium sonneborni]